MAPASGWDTLSSKWTFYPQSWCVRSRKNGQTLGFERVWQGPNCAPIVVLKLKTKKKMKDSGSPRPFGLNPKCSHTAAVAHERHEQNKQACKWKLSRPAKLSSSILFIVRLIDLLIITTGLPVFTDAVLNSHNVPYSGSKRHGLKFVFRGSNNNFDFLHRHSQLACYSWCTANIFCVILTSFCSVCGSM